MTTVIAGATVVAGPELEPRPDATLVVEGQRIAAVEGAGGAPAGAQTKRAGGAAGAQSKRALGSNGTHVIDGAGLTLVPGFIDCHVHIGLHSPREVLAGGVTTVRDLAWPPGEIHRMARASRSSGFEGPTILAAGPMLTVPGGYPTRASWAPPGTGLAVDSAGGAEHAVNEVAAAGACVVKVALNPAVGPTLPAPLLEAIVEAARARGLRVTAHVYGLDELAKALDAGVEELAHLLMSPERVPEETTLLMVERGVTIVPTIACFFGRARRVAVANLASFRAAGGHVLYGTDLGNRGPRPGIDRRELAGMAAAGYTPGEIIRSATVDAAGHLGVGDAGVIEPGRYADIVALGGRPLETVGDLSDVRMVWRRGRRVR